MDQFPTTRPCGGPRLPTSSVAAARDPPGPLARRTTGRSPPEGFCGPICPMARLRRSAARSASSASAPASAAARSTASSSRRHRPRACCAWRPASWRPAASWVRTTSSRRCTDLRSLPHAATRASHKIRAGRISYCAPAALRRKCCRCPLLCRSGRSRPRSARTDLRWMRFRALSEHTRGTASRTTSLALHGRMLCSRPRI
mmetsp:Transcript_129416/g.414809  ORF Transcript_129416/g.414809 Transcript_129416/m.414809 type:complete len:201 (-) Transcript_129416:2472-3074(-)